MSTSDWIQIWIARLLLKPSDLWRVALAGNVKAIRQLVAAEAVLNAKKRCWTYEEAVTPLHVAVDYRQVGTIKALIELGARIDAKDENGMTALMRAIDRRNIDHDDAKIVRLLIELGANVNLHSRQGDTALDKAAIAGDLQIVEMLLAHGADPNHEINGKWTTPIAQAACTGEAETLKLLLKAGASANRYFGRADEDYFPGPPLVGASLSGNPECTRLLIEAGADPNATSGDGFTAIMMAVRKKQIEILEMLIRAGADVNVKDSQGRTALSIAEEEKRENKWQRMFWITVTRDLNRYKKLDRIIQLLCAAGAKG